MTKAQALIEARRRWGDGGAVHMRPAPVNGGSSRRGRLARYRFVVGNGSLGKRCSIQGQGDSWRAAFEDARQVVSPVED